MDRRDGFIVFIPGNDPGAPFRLLRLGLHEEMPPGFVDRPAGTEDWLFMYFHSPVRLRSADGEEEVPAGALMVWSSSDGHFYGSQAGPWGHSWFHCEGAAITPLLRRSRIPLRRPLKVGPAPMAKFLIEAAAEAGGRSRPDAAILRNLFENFLRSVARARTEEGERFVPAWLLEARAEIERRFADSRGPGLPALARRAGCSAPHLCASFRRHFGVPPGRYLLRLRMDHAAYLLRDRNLRVGEIAERVGYPDLFSFSKMFKRTFGLSPRRFREAPSR